MKAIFMGSDAIALPMLRHLRKNRPGGIDLSGVFTQPDRKTGRGMRLQANAIKQWAVAEGLEVLQPVRCGQPEADYLKKESVELVLVMAYGQILPGCLLETCPGRILNLHASLLPRLRGASPIHTAVAIGLEETGVSLMQIVPRLDAGPVAARVRIPIGEMDTTGDLMMRMGDACIRLMDEVAPALGHGNLIFTEQDPEQVTYCRIIEKKDSHLDFRRPARELVNRIRAFQPWPGTSFPFADQEIRIKAARVAHVDGAAREPGAVFLHPDGSLCIACTEDAVRLLELQRSGGRALPTEEFIRGFPIPAGTILESRQMDALEGRTPFPYRKKTNS